MGSSSTKPNSKVTVNQRLSFSWKRGRKIGQGAFGQVYECRRVDTGELLATKFVQLHGTTHEIVQEIQSLKKEIIVLKGLMHKNIVKYITTDVASDCSGIDIIMEYISGGSVSDSIKKHGKLNESVVRDYISQVLQGLEYLHSKGIVHRDLKCANLLVSTEGVVKLSDFGASRQVAVEGRDQLCKSLRGSPYWIAPEVARRSGHSFSADIWSLGCVIIEMLTGVPPWANYSQSAKEVLSLVSRTEVPPEIPLDASALCRDFMCNCLRVDSAERMSAAGLLEHSFIQGMDPYEVSYDISDFPQTSVNANDIPVTGSSRKLK